MPKTIKLVFDMDSGECQVETSGFKGPSCRAASDFLVRALGSCSDFQQKKEWFESNLVNGSGINTNLCG
jgi:hypothetical protein